MQLSLGETEALAAKAMRGVGASWGTAEEAGKAVRWLEAHGAAGLDALAALLIRWPGEAIQLGPEGWYGARQDGEDGSTGARLCPIRAGMTLCDHSGLLGGKQLTLHRLSVPELLHPFLHWAGYRVARHDEPVILVPGRAPPLCGTARRSVAGSVLETLESFAHKTYVPATEASRRAGAGAGVSDND